MAYNVSEFNPLGGNRLILHEFSSAFVSVTPIVVTAGLETGMQLGHLLAESFDSSPAEETFKNTHRDVIKTINTDAPITEGIMAQKGKALQDFLMYRVRGKMYLQIHYQEISDGKWQEEFSFVTVVAQRNNSWTDSTGGNAFRYKATKIIMTADRTITSANLTAIAAGYSDAVIRRSTDVIILSGRYDYLAETTVA